MKKSILAEVPDGVTVDLLLRTISQGAKGLVWQSSEPSAEPFRLIFKQDGENIAVQKTGVTPAEAKWLSEQFDHQTRRNALWAQFKDRSVACSVKIEIE